MRAFLAVLCLAALSLPAQTRPAAKRPRPRAAANASAATARLEILPDVAVAPENLLRFAPPKAAVLVGLRPAQLLESLLIKPFMAQVALLAGATGQGSLDKMMAELRKVEKVTLAAAPGATPTAAPEMLALIEGDFRQGLPEMLRQQKGLTAFRVNPNLLLAGPPAAAKAAYARLAARVPEPVAKVANESAPLASSDLWLVADLTDWPEIRKLASARRTGAAASLEDLRRVALGITFRDDLSVQGQLGTATPEAALQLLAVLKEEMAKSAPELKGVEMAAEGTTVKFSATMKAAEIEAAMKNVREKGVLAASAPPESTVVAKPVAPRKAVVWGMEPARP